MPAKDKFSPGPWSVQRGTIDLHVYCGLDGAFSRRGLNDVKFEFSERDFANANLMRKAPELLAALRNFMGWLDTPVGRMMFKDDEFYAEAIAEGRKALEGHGLGEGVE